MAGRWLLPTGESVLPGSTCSLSPAPVSTISSKHNILLGCWLRCYHRVPAHRRTPTATLATTLEKSLGTWPPLQGCHGLALRGTSSSASRFSGRARVDYVILPQ